MHSTLSTHVLCLVCADDTCNKGGMVLLRKSVTKHLSSRSHIDNMMVFDSRELGMQQDDPEEEEEWEEEEEDLEEMDVKMNITDTLPLSPRYPPAQMHEEFVADGMSDASVTAGDQDYDINFFNDGKKFIFDCILSDLILRQF